VADKKLEDLVYKLAERTRSGKLAWEGTARQGVYQAAFPNYYVNLFDRDAPDGTTDYVLRIFNREGTLVDEIADVDFARERERVPTPYITMQEMFNQARRIVMGADQAVDEILASLE
jgi:hypothetical protein